MKYVALLLITAFVFFGSCTDLKVTSDVDKTVDFTKYKTYEYYGWQKDSGKLLNDIDKERIERAFSEEFSARGLQYVKENGDLIVTLFIVTEKKTTTTANTTMMGARPVGYGGYYGWGPGWGWGGGYSTTTVNSYDYKVGTLVCDVYDAKAKKLIWEGIAKGTISENLKNREKNIQLTVAEIMKQYPVKPLNSK